VDVGVVIGVVTGSAISGRVEAEAVAADDGVARGGDGRVGDSAVVPCAAPKISVVNGLRLLMLRGSTGA
jgi:hypothetical protein